jgi:TolB protein
MVGPVVQDEQAAHPDWSPVSRQIVYQSSSSGSWDLYVLDADTAATGPRQLTADPSIEGLPSWSPDGQWIAYLSDAGGNWGIWIIRADGTERHLLFPFDGGIFTPQAVEPYGQRDWIDEQISWSE